MISKKKNGTSFDVRIVAKVGDLRLKEIYEGFSEVTIVEPEVKLHFVGADSQFIDVENPFDTLVMDPFKDSIES